MSTDYISILAPSPILCLYYSALLFYYYAGVISKGFAYYTEAFVVHPDNTWQCFQASYNYYMLDVAVD